MLKNYFKIAWRNLIRNKTFSTINILGLGLGMACSLLIILWVQDERSIDGFHTNSKQLFLVYERNYYEGKTDAGYATQGLLANELKKNIPEVENAGSIDYAAAPGTGNTFEAGNKLFKMTGYYAGEDFLKMFSYSLLLGTKEAALSIPHAVAISRKMAERFFGNDEKAVGKTIRFENKEDLQVTAVFENVPVNSSIQFDFLRSWTDYIQQNDWVHNWGNTSPSTFIQLRKDADAAKVEASIKDFIYRYQKKTEGFRMELALQPYAEKYLHSTFKNGYVDGGRIEYVRLFTIVALFILIIACINFMNLATAQSAKRAKEVGLRKVIGAMRSSLMGQFIGEAMLLTLLSIIVAIILTIALLPAFDALTGKQISLPFTQPLFWLSLIGFTLITGLAAGSYPALYLSSLSPVRVLKGSLKFSFANIFLRKGLVVFQFTLSVILIVGMMVIGRQVAYIQTKNIGYDRENLIYLPIEGELVKSFRVFKQEAAALPGIIDISKMRNSPTDIEHHTGDISWPGKSPDAVVSFADGVTGYDFVKTMKLQLKEGRDFSTAFASDSVAYLINETAVQKMGMQNPVGQIIKWGNHPGKIIGVLKDFHFNSIHKAIDPLIMRLDEAWPWGTILVRMQAGSTKEVIAALEKLYKKLAPKVPFAYQFSDQEFTKLYRSEELVSKLSGYFSSLAFFISCLGLFGLATLTAAQRRKEIGVRKVLGASVANIAGMLSRNFLKLVLIALLIGFPVAWLAMNHWLQNFAYRIDIEWWMFALAAIAATGIALLTVCFQAVKAALANPVKSLRAE